MSIAYGTGLPCGVSSRVSAALDPPRWSWEKGGGQERGPVPACLFEEVDDEQPVRLPVPKAPKSRPFAGMSDEHGRAKARLGGLAAHRKAEPVQPEPEASASQAAGYVKVIKKPRRRLKPEERAEVVRLWLEGNAKLAAGEVPETMTEIGRRFGITMQGVNYILRQAFGEEHRRPDNRRRRTPQRCADCEQVATMRGRCRRCESRRLWREDPAWRAQKERNRVAYRSRLRARQQEERERMNATTVETAPEPSPPIRTRKRAKEGKRIGDWDVEWKGVNTHISDRTRGQAKAIVLERIRDSVGPKVKYTELKVRRCFAGGIWCRVSANPRWAKGGGE